MKKVHLTYFKPSGKYYSEGEYTTALEYSFDIYPQVRNMKKGEFPGLNESSLWAGYILVVPDNGVPAKVEVHQGQYAEQQACPVLRLLVFP